MTIKLLIFGVLSLVGAYFGLRYIIAQLEEIDTAMQIRLGLVEAKKMYELKYGFRSRVEELRIENNIGQLGFTQFRGRL